MTEGRGALTLLLGLGFFLFQLVLGRDRVVGTILQIGDHGRDFGHGMKNIAAAGDVRHGQFLAGADAGAEIGDGGRGSKTTLL